MRHWTQPEMMLRYYGEDPGRTDVAHLADCEICRSEYSALERTLAELAEYDVPARGDSYPAFVWHRIRPRMAGPVPARRRLPAWLAVAALVLAAFFLGRMGAPAPEQPVASTPGPVRDRVLMVALGEHLERSRIVLVELSNAPDGKAVDISGERASAEDLLATNRLYRQTAAAAGDRGVEDLLEDLELLLVEIAHSPDRISSRELEDVRTRIDSRGVLFKLRVIESRLEASPMEVERMD